MQRTRGGTDQRFCRKAIETPPRHPRQEVRPHRSTDQRFCRKAIETSSALSRAISATRRTDQRFCRKAIETRPTWLLFQPSPPSRTDQRFCRKAIETCVFHCFVPFFCSRTDQRFCRKAIETCMLVSQRRNRVVRVPTNDFAERQLRRGRRNFLQGGFLMYRPTILPKGN